MTGRAQEPPAELLLDEMFSPELATQLRRHGHRVTAVADTPELRALSDLELFEWAAVHSVWLLTENVKDFRPLLRAAADSGRPHASLLLTSSRTFPRSRRNPRPLLDALLAWLKQPGSRTSSTEEWLQRGS